MYYSFYHQFNDINYNDESIHTDGKKYPTYDDCTTAAVKHFEQMSAEHFRNYDFTEISQFDDDCEYEANYSETIELSYVIRLETYFIDEDGRLHNTQTVDIEYSQHRPDINTRDFTAFMDDIDPELIPDGCDEIYWYEIWHRGEMIWRTPFYSVRELLEERM